jgi:hypothetical protein
MGAGSGAFPDFTNRCYAFFWFGNIADTAVLVKRNCPVMRAAEKRWTGVASSQATPQATLCSCTWHWTIA